jgi:hypothetical protein
MARTVILLKLRPAPGSRPAGLFNKIQQFPEKVPYEQRFHSEIGKEQVGEQTMVL